MGRWRKREEPGPPRSTTPEPEHVSLARQAMADYEAREPPEVVDLTVGPVPPQRTSPTD